MITEIGWSIYNKEHGLYYGWCLTKRDAIREHCCHLDKAWEHCRKDGDKAVKIEITYDHDAKDRG